MWVIHLLQVQVYFLPLMHRVLQDRPTHPMGETTFRVPWCGHSLIIMVNLMVGLTLYLCMGVLTSLDSLRVPFTGTVVGGWQKFPKLLMTDPLSVLHINVILWNIGNLLLVDQPAQFTYTATYHRWSYS